VIVNGRSEGGAEETETEETEETEEMERTEERTEGTEEETEGTEDTGSTRRHRATENGFVQEDHTAGVVNRSSSATHTQNY